MYQTVAVTAIVLQILERSEYDATYVVYTKEMGKLFVQAKGIRKITAKHTANMQPLSIVSLDLIKGQVGWRLVGSRQIVSYWSQATFPIRSLWGRVLRVVIDLTPIEQVDQAVFTILEHMFAEYGSDVEVKVIPYVEARILAELLEAFGWWNGDKTVSETLRQKPNPRDFITVVNRGLETAYA